MPAILDSDLAKITEQDREYAGDLIEDLSEITSQPMAGTDEQRELIASWFRKVRYEAVIADRRNR